jgi:hypothetical protein
MRLAVEVDGRLEVTWMWLPSFIGMNQELRDRIDTALANRFAQAGCVGDEPWQPAPFGEDQIDEAHELVVRALLETFPPSKISGLSELFDAILHCSYS